MLQWAQCSENKEGKMICQITSFCCNDYLFSRRGTMKASFKFHTHTFLKLINDINDFNGNAEAITFFGIVSI